MTEIARIQDNEEIKLRGLLMKANDTDNDSDWQIYMDYMKMLGEKYHFDPRKVQINTRGIVSLLPKSTAFVIYNTSTGIPETVFLNKKQASEYLIKGQSIVKDLDVQEVPIE